MLPTRRKRQRICEEMGFSLHFMDKAAAGLPANSIYKWDKNSPAYTKVVAVADVLQVSLDDLCKD